MRASEALRRAGTTFVGNAVDRAQPQQEGPPFLLSQRERYGMREISAPGGGERAGAEGVSGF